MAMSDDAVSLPSNEESPVDLPSDGETSRRSRWQPVQLMFALAMIMEMCL